MHICVVLRCLQKKTHSSSCASSSSFQAAVPLAAHCSTVSMCASDLYSCPFDQAFPCCWVLTLAALGFQTVACCVGFFLCHIEGEAHVLSRVSIIARKLCCQFHAVSNQFNSESMLVQKLLGRWSCPYLPRPPAAAANGAKYRWKKSISSLSYDTGRGPQLNAGQSP